MKLRNEGAEIFIPDGKPVAEAIERTTHMAVAAHQDDIEIMALDGILECFGKENYWFTAVVVTNGAGSPRDDLYASYTGEQMQRVRKQEQKKAAYVGEYSAAVMMDYTSREVKSAENRSVVEEIRELVNAARPEVLFTHNLADKHDTHIGVVVKVIKALRELPREVRPKKLYGCEVWRNLDWLNDDEKLTFDVSGHPNLAASLIGVFDSQICGGKRYDLAAAGRRVANATYSQSHHTDKTSAASYGMDLTPLIEDDAMDIIGYIEGAIERFKQDVSSRISRMA